MSEESILCASDPRASLTIGPVTFFSDGEIRVREGTPPTEIATLVLAAVKEGQAKAIARYLLDRRASDGDAFDRVVRPNLSAGI